MQPTGNSTVMISQPISSGKDEPFNRAGACLVPDIRFHFWNVNTLLRFLSKYLDLVKKLNQQFKFHSEYNCCSKARDKVFFTSP